MKYPSEFILIGAAVVALSPKSHGRLLLFFLREYIVIDEFRVELLDNGGRFLQFCVLVFVAQLLENVL
jgi:hypothetical protein